MPRLEPDFAVVPLESDRTGPPAVAANYGAVRFNALKHGVLSRHVVLPHEDRTEYDELRDALVAEHEPTGATELHLIEELAGILWRKRRVLMAEGAKINEGLKSAVNSPRTVIRSAAPLERALPDDDIDLRDLLDTTPIDVVESQRDAALDLAATRKAAATLRKGGSNAYNKARRALLPESRNWWDEQVENGSYPASAVGLGDFIRETLEPVCWRVAKESELTPAIRAQTLGEGLQAHRLEQLNRYETHLDRKFERTLAMLLKLKELRGP